MSTVGDLDPQQQVEITARSSVKIEMNSKGMAQVKVAVYAGEEESEMQRVKDLAVNTYNVTIRALAGRTAGE